MKDLVVSPILRSWNALDRLFAESFYDGFAVDNFVVDITDTEGTITLKAELPGVKKEDISVDLNDGVLILKAEKKDQFKEKSESILRQESHYGVMQRSFTVGDIDTENVQALYEDGILTVSLKKKDSEFKKIEIG